MKDLQIPDPRQRALVHLMDAALQPLRWARRTSAHGEANVRRVLLLRLERIGDLLMVLDAIADARAFWPEAEIDLAVGSWNLTLARMIPGINRIETMDVPWLAREQRGDSWPALLRRARGWAGRRYDVVVNFEPDIRSNVLAFLSGAARRVGYWTGGGGALLTDAGTYDPAVHVALNARQLVARAAGRPFDRASEPVPHWPALTPSAEAVAAADALLAGAKRPLIGVHASGGRQSKQWHLDRFAAVAAELARTQQGTIVLTGSAADRPLIDVVKQQLEGRRVIDAGGTLDLPALAALLERLDLFVTADTGPMHLAATMGTPVVALFGPANPVRYGPRGPRQRILRVDLPCSPCGLVRLPPERCRGHVPDCMDGITVQAVVAAAIDLLSEPRRGAVMA